MDEVDGSITLGTQEVLYIDFLSSESQSRGTKGMPFDLGKMSKNIPHLG
jgi:hypothetical protein